MVTKYYGLGIGILVALALVAGIFYFQKDSILSMFGMSDVATSSNSLVLPDGTVVTSVGGGKVELDTIEPPSTDRAITITTVLSPEAISQLRQNMETIIAALKKEPKRVDLWLQLGVYRKMAGDNEGARMAWEYVAAAGPATVNFVAYGNLGDLYKSYLKDFVKSEANYKEAIKLRADSIDYYRNLFELYTTFGYKSETSAAADLLKQGLISNPGNKDLLMLQAQLKNSQ